MAGTGLLTSWGVGGRRRVALHSAHDRQPVIGGLGVCVSHPHPSQIWLVSGESSDSRSISGQKENSDVIRSNQTRNGHLWREASSLGPHSSWVVEPLWTRTTPSFGISLPLHSWTCCLMPRLLHGRSRQVWRAKAWTAVGEGGSPLRVTLNLHDPRSEGLPPITLVLDLARALCLVQIGCGFNPICLQSLTIIITCNFCINP